MIARRAFPLGYLAAAAVALACSLGTAAAQNLNLAGSGDGAPVEVFADQGIEWLQDEKLFRAHGNARALRAGTEVRADILSARYRETPGGKSQVWRMEASGNVEIETEGGKARGDTGVYDLDQGVLVLTGDNLELVARGDRVVARDSLEYWIERKLAVARGKARVTHGDRRLSADVLTAILDPDQTRDRALKRVDALGNVRIETNEEVVIAEKGVYNVAAGTVTLGGSVRITKGANQLNGCGAVVDLGSGVSRLYSCPKEKGGGRVKGYLSPKSGPTNKTK